MMMTAIALLTKAKAGSYFTPQRIAPRPGLPAGCTGRPACSDCSPRAPRCTLTLTLRHLNHPTQYVVTLHEWHPEGQAYAGLPTDLNDARERRAARMTVLAQDRPLPPAALAEANPAPLPPNQGLTDYCLDLRYRA